MAINEAGRQLVRDFEGLRLNAYVDPVGVLTIGYGHTAGVKRGDRITAEQAEALLAQDLNDAEGDVNSLVKAPLTANQKAALASFVFNLGKGRLAVSTLLKKLNGNDYAGAAAEFGKWVKGTDPKTKEKVTLPGLVKRRAAETTLFLK